MRSGALDEYRAFGRLPAKRYGGKIFVLECWNEPNLWGYIYPQRTASDLYFGARAYLRLLKAFSRGVRSAGTCVPVIGGATAPVGLNDKLRTSPQRFTRFLKSKGASRWFDAYSHHPYGTLPVALRTTPPRDRPNNPAVTVTLSNLRHAPPPLPPQAFYLTEYGYNTRTRLDFGGFTVTEANQAKYLRRAYAPAGRYRQVKAFFWFLVWDALHATRRAMRSPGWLRYTSLWPPGARSATSPIGWSLVRSIRGMRSRCVDMRWPVNTRAS